MSVSILVVDDEPEVADLFRQCFRREARNGTYVLHFAYSGEEGEIKTRRPHLPVMMVTAYGDDERRHLAGKYGAAEFITKPVDFDFLKTQLRDLSDAAD
jgi:CheY-like chemotaxis protein